MNNETRYFGSKVLLETENLGWLLPIILSFWYEHYIAILDVRSESTKCYMLLL